MLYFILLNFVGSSIVYAAIPEENGGLRKFIDCQKIQHFTDKYYGIVGSCPYPLVDDGSKFGISDIRSKCSHNYDSQIGEIPVTYKIEQITFRNIFCAICHGKFSKISRWDMKIDCLGGVKFKPSLTDLDLSHCKFTIVKPLEIILSECYKPTKRELPSDLTESSFHVREDDGPLKELQLGYSTLLNFGFDGQSHNLLMTSVRDDFLQLTECGTGKIYNPASKECIQLNCPMDHVPYFDKCIIPLKPKNSDYCFDLRVSYKIQEGADDEKLDLAMVLSFLLAYGFDPKEIKELSIVEGDSLSTRCHAQQPVNSTSQLIGSNMTLFSSPHCPSTTAFHNGTKIISILHHTSMPADNFLRNHSLFPVNHLPTDQSDLQPIDQPLGCAMSTSVTAHEIRERWCHGFVKFYKNNEFTVLLQGNNITGIFVHSTNLTYPREQFSYTEVVYGDFWGNISKIVFVCDKMPKIEGNSTCPRMALQPGEYELFLNRSINVFYLQEIVTFVEDLAEHRETFNIGDFDEPIPTVFNMDEYEYAPSALSNSSYFRDANQSVYICIPPQVITLLLQLTTWDSIEFASSCSFLKTFGNVSSYSGLAFSALSFLSMVVVLVTYSLFRSMRTLPGINLMHLTVAIILSQTLFLSSTFIDFGANDTTHGCFVMAILTHYFTLASFMWMNVMAYTSYRAFGADFKTRVARLDKRHILYNCLYAWGLPALIVLVCAIVDYSYRDKKYINYGEVTAIRILENKNADGSIESLKVVYRRMSSCWIGNSTAALIIFGVPLIYCMFVNIVLFCRTCIGMRDKTEIGRPKTILRRDSGSGMLKNRSDMHIHIRLMAQYGFAWIIGIVIIVIGTTRAESVAVCWALHVLNFVFNVLHGCTGLFLFFAFIINKRTWFLYKDFCNKRSNKPKRSISYRSSVVISSLYSITGSTEINNNSSTS